MLSVCVKKKFSIECGKLNTGLFWFGLCYVIGVENSLCHFLNKSDSKLKSVATWTLVFSCALGNLLFLC